ncbi:MAG: hypothetical protein QOD32_2503 [Pyrinomonadaceae bacterium]|nr:hypothetical protein [Pyrinomonadaceae bacterium]
MLTGRKLLLADDSLTIQKVVSLTFDDEGFEVTTAGSGAEALQRLGESLPDIVLADVFMPEPNGYALCERIKTDERTRHIPVVLLVGTFEPFNEAEARRVGADEVLTKPFQSIRDLVNKVGGLLGGQPEEKTPDAAASRDEHHDADEATRDLSPFAADARAADPAAGSDTATNAPADAFGGFDLDDATIQTTPAAAFDAHPQQHAAAHDFSEINLEEQFSDRGETDEAFVLSDDDAPAPEIHAAAASASASSPASAAASSSASAAASSSASASASSSNSYPAAASHVAESAFDAHASRAAEADDALLELGDDVPARAAADESDDFILDIGDEDDFDAPATAAAPAHDATAEADMFFAEHAQTTQAPEAFTMPEALTETEVLSETEASAESHSFAESQASEEPEMFASPTAAAATFAEAEPELLAEEPEELEAPAISEASSLMFANEPSAPDARDAESSTGQEDSHAQHAPAWDGDPTAASIVAHAGGVAAHTAAWGESQTVETEAAGASMAAVAADASATATPSESSPASSSESSPASSEAGQASSSEVGHASSPASSLSPEMLDEVVRRVVAHMSEQVVREIAWEVVPDLAERLIKQRLEEEQKRAQS